MPLAKAAGCTHAIIPAHWVNLQPIETGTIDAGEITRIKGYYAQAKSLGLKAILSLNLHYAPAWVLSSVEPFRDHHGNEWLETGGGKGVRNWMWTSQGRAYVSDLVTRFAAGIGSSNVFATVGVRFGGGGWGELHYPASMSGDQVLAWQGFGASMQTGASLASGMTACPLPGYVPYSGTDAQDATWIEWYLSGLASWAKWFASQYKNAGFTRNLYILLPGYGVRSNWLRGDVNYRLECALGHDHARMINAFAGDLAVHPYVALNTWDAVPGGTQDSDKSSWKSIYEKALAVDKHRGMIGENIGGEDNAGMDSIFSGALSNLPYAGCPAPPTDGCYYQGCIWVNYQTMIDGSSHATLAHYQAKIAAAT